MKEIKLTVKELLLMYENPQKGETDFQRNYRMGRNSIVLELIEKNKKG